MNKKLVGATVIALALGLLGARGADAQSWPWSQNVCGGSTLQACVDFSLDYDATNNRYFFTVLYASTTQTYAPNQGVITAGGIYDPAGAPNFDLSNVLLETGLSSITQGWAAYDGDASGCQHLNGAGTTLLEGCADTNNGVNFGLLPGDYVTFSFQSDYAFDPASVGNAIGARAHFQSYGSNECSFKLDSNLGVVSPPQGGVDACGSVVPEPMTVFLLATGLVGIGAVGYRNRRREDEQA